MVNSMSLCCHSKRLPLIESTMITVIVPIRRMSLERPHVQTQGRTADGGVRKGFVLNTQDSIFT